MTITISGTQGEGKTCIANVVRQALENTGIMPTGFGDGDGLIPWFEATVAADMLPERLKIVVVETLQPPAG